MSLRPCGEAFTSGLTGFPVTIVSGGVGLPPVSPVGVFRLRAKTLEKDPQRPMSLLPREAKFLFRGLESVFR